MPTVSTQYEGFYERTINGDGHVRVFSVDDLNKDTTDSQIEAFVAFHIDDTNYDHDNLPFARSRTARTSSTHAFVRVQWGVVGGGGGGGLPVAFGQTETVIRSVSIPTYRLEPRATEGLFWKQFSIPWRRPVTIWRFNVRIDDQSYPVVKWEAAVYQGMIMPFSRNGNSVGFFRLVGQRFYELASGERRGELTFEQPALIRPFPGSEGSPGTLGNEHDVPVLDVGEKYVDLGTPGDTPTIVSRAVIDLYFQVPQNAFIPFQAAFTTQ